MVTARVRRGSGGGQGLQTAQVGQQVGEVDSAEGVAPAGHLAFSFAHDREQLGVGGLLHGGGAQLWDMPETARRSVGVGVAAVAAGAIGEKDVASVFGGCRQRGGTGGDGWRLGRGGVAAGCSEQERRGKRDGAEGQGEPSYGACAVHRTIVPRMGPWWGSWIFIPFARYKPVLESGVRRLAGEI